MVSYSLYLLQAHQETSLSETFGAARVEFNTSETATMSDDCLQVTFFSPCEDYACIYAQFIL